MDILEVKDRILNIQLSQDSQGQYAYEDALFRDFVKAIIANKYETKEEIIKIASEVIKVTQVEYDRWYS